MKIGILGGDVKELSKALRKEPEQLYLVLRKIAEHLAISENDLVAIPEQGSMSEFVAEVYRENDGNKIIGIIPMQDKEFGVSEINTPVCDEMVNSGTWCNSASVLIKRSDMILCLGFSPRSVIELCSTRWYPKEKVYVIDDLITQRLPMEIQNQLNISYIRLRELESFISEKENLQHKISPEQRIRN